MSLANNFRKNVVTATPVDTVGEVAELMASRHVGAVIVVDGQKPIGIVTDRDIALGLGVRGLNRADTVSLIMATPVITVKEHEGIFKATQLIRRLAGRRLPIVDEHDRVVGIITADDLLLILAKELQNVASAIEPEVEAAGPVLETV